MENFERNFNIVSKIVVRNRNGEQIGLPSVCSAHPDVLTACARLAARRRTPLLIESTCNQVNQDGGYTGLTPAQFAANTARLVLAAGLQNDQLILGGDHLGPYPWRSLPAADAMQKARQLVADYVRAGYTKIHLDTSLSCAGDPPDPLPKELIAQRSAWLCQAAEEALAVLPPGSPLPCYVIGTEVPVPGGVQVEMGALHLTTTRDACETLDVTREAFLQQGLAGAWARVVALVVQPGVEFGDAEIHSYDRDAAIGLARFIETRPGLIYEAHSTDYQTRQALGFLVADHFAILKVGPGLTYAYREAMLALEEIEKQVDKIRNFVSLSFLADTLETAMLANPVHWKAHYGGSEVEQAFARKFSFSDRVRYYWAEPRVADAVSRLWNNLGNRPIPLSLLSQFLPAQFEKIGAGQLTNEAHEIMRDKIADFLAGYYSASGW